jgi:hypothetical protein|tara:strand:+ start:1404 stop:1808 length:405 start_codon:yes stop_codon:yes gene_type:complete
LNTPGTRAYFNTLINAPKFSNDPVGHRQKKRWQLIAGDIYKSTSIEALLEARGKAEGYIHGVVDAGHLSTKDTDRDYLVLCVVQRRRDFLKAFPDGSDTGLGFEGFGIRGALAHGDPCDKGDGVHVFLGGHHRP